MSGNHFLTRYIIQNPKPDIASRKIFQYKGNPQLTDTDYADVF